ncbi:hypothetical protein ACFW6V_25720 [Streptomyces sp. NPDC058734]|uniref:hypothetical protein n=1 Tax=Streptomyces sp. NPDC058734 TaxID=3346615 RepID=UPI0036A9FAE8
MPVYRYRVHDALTGSVLVHDFPLSDVEFGPGLSEPGDLSGAIPVPFRHLVGSAISPANSVLVVERDDTVMWGGLTWRAEPEGDKFPIEAGGWGSYLHRRHDLHGNLDGRGPYVNADACQVIRDVWAYAQSQPDGNLSVVVDPSASRTKVGTPAEPYKVDWWEAPVLGDVVEDMTKVEGGPEWTESTVYADGRPSGQIRLGWPRLGTRRTDIMFASGANIVEVAPVIYDGDEYAQVVIALGAGEGRGRRRAVDAVRNKRLRMERVVEVPAEKGADRLATRARRERIARQVLGEVHEIQVVDHPMAPVGSWQIGDDVRVRVHDQWVNWDGWCRITGWRIRPPQGDEGERITLSLARADRFVYGG